MRQLQTLVHRREDDFLSGNDKSISRRKAMAAMVLVGWEKHAHELRSIVKEDAGRRA